MDKARFGEAPKYKIRVSFLMICAFFQQPENSLEIDLIFSTRCGNYEQKEFPFRRNFS